MKNKMPVKIHNIYKLVLKDDGKRMSISSMIDFYDLMNKVINSDPVVTPSYLKWIKSYIVW